MLDSCGMTESDDKPPTLASLRARRGNLRYRKQPSPDPAEPQSQGGLFSVFSETSQSPYSQPDRDTSNHEELVLSSTKLSGKPISASPVTIERRVWTVRALVSNVRQHIETSYTDLWVEGEISNCRSAPSEHICFTLKDGEIVARSALPPPGQPSTFRPPMASQCSCAAESPYETAGQLQS